MMRVSTFVLGTVIAAIAAATSGCTAQASLTVKTKTRFIEDGVTKEDAVDWNGTDKIVIDDEAVGVSVNGGLEVIADPSTTKISATARMLAMANDDDKASADQSIVDAKATFTISGSGGGTVTISCRHGGSHGSSNGGESGCEKLVVRVPAGSEQNVVNLKALVGNGGMKVSFSGGAIGTLEGNSNGGDIEISAPATKGGTISFQSEKSDDVTLRLPQDFAADNIVLNADEGKAISTFDDAKVGDGAGGRGQAGSGLAQITLTSKQFAGSSGTVTLTQ